MSSWDCVLSMLSPVSGFSPIKCVSGPCAVELNRGWSTTAICCHVDKILRVESACAGSNGQVFSTNQCGSRFRSSEDGPHCTARNVAT